MDLSGEWLVRPADTGPAPEHDAGWLPCTVPSHWADIPDLDPETRGAVHRRRFDHPGPAADERQWLVFDGLCYQGDVWLDGTYLGDTEGWFAPHRFEVGELLGARREHVLDVEVTCPPPAPPDGRRALVGALQDPRFVPPSFNPGGLWRPVHVHTTGPVPILHLRAVCTTATASRAEVHLRAVVHAPAATTVRLRTTVGAHDHEQSRSLAEGENQLEWDVTVPDPDRWWPRSLGSPVLHPLTVEVVLEDGRVSDRRERRIGLRSVALDGWTFRVNGERLFVKGAIVGPTTPSPATASTEAVHAHVDDAVALGLDLLRVHTHVARGELYDRADETGLLLWQDMPMHGGFARTARRTAQHQARDLVDLLGHHPSVVLWNVHDEPHAAWLQPDSATGRLLDHQRPTWNRAVLDRSVRRSLRKADPSRPIDLHGGLLPNLSSLDGTDSHLWFGWRSGRAEDLAGFIARLPRAGRFVSDFGAWSVPTGSGGVDPDPDPDEPLWWNLLRLVPPETHPDAATWRTATQAHQAEVLRVQIEILRRLKYRPTGGFTFSQLVDGRPDIGAGVIDAHGRRKLAWDAVVQACAPVIVTAPLPPEVVPGQTLELDVHVVSDLRHPLEDARVTAELAACGGSERWGWSGTIPADACVRVGQVRWTVPAEPGDLRLALGLTAGDVTVDRTSLSTILPKGGRGVYRPR